MPRGDGGAEGTDHLQRLRHDRAVALKSKGLCYTCYTKLRQEETCCQCRRQEPAAFRDEQGPWCRLCRSKNRAEPCCVCGRGGRVAARRDGKPVCHRCWQREHRVPKPCYVCGRTMKATKNTPSGPMCSTCHRKTLPKETCWVCGRVTVASAHTEEGAWCENCRKKALAEPCSLCGITRKITAREEDGSPVCNACYQRRTRSLRPRHKCVDCGEMRAADRIAQDGPLCEKCNNRRAPMVLCPRCGQRRKIGVLSTGICRACTQQMRTREPCHICRRSMPVSFRDDQGQPWCDNCRRRDQAQPCCGCGITKVVTARDARGPWCSACWQHARPGPTCGDCGQNPSMPMASWDGTPRCVSCYGIARVPCSRCGTLARAERRWPEGPVCLPCVDAVRFTHAACHRCGQLAAVFRQEEAGPLCPECAGVNFAYRCPTCSAMGRLLHGQCPRCRAMQELEETFAGPDGRRSAQLAPLAEVLEQYEQPYSLVLYLRRPGGQLIRAMASGDLECSHTSLDALRQTASVHHLRALLVLAEVLEPREEQLAQFKRDIKMSLDKVTDPHDRNVLARYARWHLMPLAHHRLDREGFNRYQRENLRRKLQTARLLLDYIRRRSRTLDNVTQTLVDRWLIANKSRQNHARSFLLWAATSHLIPETVAIASATRTIDRSIMSDADRIVTALRLETDDSEHITDRVAGCLVL